MNQITSVQPLLTIDDLSKILGYEKKSIYDMLYRDPGILPPLFKLSRRTRALRWHAEVVDRWIRERAGLPAPSPSPSPGPTPKRGPGRPRKEGGAK